MVMKRIEAELERTEEGIVVNVYKRENVDTWEEDILVDALVDLDLPKGDHQQVIVSVWFEDVKFDG